ncbi:DUF4870 domain-containing protein [Pilimelia columellifera]
MTESPQQPGDQPPGHHNDPTAPPPPPPGAFPPAPPPGGYGQPPAASPYGGPPQPENPYGAPTPGGYSPPPAGNVYGSPTGGPGYPTPGVPVGYANSDEKTWALIAHFGALLVGFVAPLVAMLAKGNESPTVRAHAIESLNFQITWTLIAIVGGGVTCGFGLIIIVPVMIIMPVIAGIKANDGQLYRYPLTFRMIK